MMDVTLQGIVQSLICIVLAVICACRGGAMKGAAKRSIVYAYTALILGAVWCGIAPWQYPNHEPWVLPWPALGALAGAAAVLILGSPAWRMGLPSHLRR